MRYQHQIVLDKYDVELLHRYVDDFDFMYLKSGDFVFSEEELTDWFDKQFDRYSKGQPFQWSRTPNIEADDLLKEICETAAGWLYDFEFVFEE